MHRSDMIAGVDQWHEPWDIVVIGGGAANRSIANATPGPDFR
jgi:hypothetical protein